jgi:curli biogenesis system outer membrane secretion channel CsgG
MNRATGAISTIAVIFALSACASTPALSTPVPATTSVSPGHVPAGTWNVGEDIPAGTYKVSDIADATCYWEIDSRDGTILQNNIGGGLPKVQLKTGQTFVTNSCPIWDKVK